MAASISDGAPKFLVRESKEGAWFVIADWPHDGEEKAAVCLSEEECHHWIRTKAVGWLQGRSPPMPR
jgi:hypothetical protein